MNAHDPRVAALIERSERFGQRVEAERNQIARLRHGLAVVFGVAEYRGNGLSEWSGSGGGILDS